MADSTLPNLTELNATPADADELYIVDKSDTTDGATGSNKKITRTNLVGGLQAQPAEGAFVDGDKTKLDGIETAADVTDAVNVAAAGAPIITSGAGAPSSTPSAVGDIYVDTTNDNIYMATDTASSADWDQATGAGGGDLLAANNLSDVAVAATALSNIGGIGAATSDTLTNKTFDANGTGNSLSNVDVADLANGTDGELITWDAAGAPATVAAGTATHVLTSNGAGAAPTFQAAAGGGGQTLYDHVVASSGGDYTTLQDALAGASDGDTIFVRSGNYALTANDTHATLTNITIVGENPETSVIDLVSYILTFTAGTVHFRNVGFTATSGSMVVAGNESSMMGCTLKNTAANTATGLAQFTGERPSIIGNKYKGSAALNCVFYASGEHAIVSDNTFSSTSGNQSATTGWIHFTGFSTNISGNTFEHQATASQRWCVYGTGQLYKISDNTIYGTTGIDGSGIRTSQSGLIIGNYIYDSYQPIYVVSSSTVTVVGNHIGECGSGQPAIFIDSDNSLVASNTISHPGTTGNMIDVSGNRINVIGNNISGGIQPIFIDATSDRCTVIGNSITFAAQYGTGIMAQGDKVHIASNQIQITYNGTDPYGIFVTGPQANVVGNTITSDSGTKGVGIFVDTDGDYSNIVGNRIDACRAGISIHASAAGCNVNDNYIFDPSSYSFNFNDNETVQARDNMVDDTSYYFAPANSTKMFTMDNGSGTTVNAGELIVYDPTSGEQYFTTTTTQGDDLVIGMAAENISTGAIGWVKTEGKTKLLKVDGTTDIAVGDFIGCFTTAGIGMKAASGDMAIAIALEAYTTDDSNGVIDALLISPRKI